MQKEYYNNGQIAKKGNFMPVIVIKRYKKYNKINCLYNIYR